MAVEVEAAILEVDLPRLRRRIEHLGGVRTQSAFVREQVYGPPSGEGNIQVRDEGVRVRVAYKRQIGDLRREERQYYAQDFEAVLAFFDALGLRRTLYREKHRLSYQVGSGVVCLDQYPGIPPLAEVEAEDEAAVAALCAKLGLDYAARGPTDVPALYRHYGIQLAEGACVRFSEEQRQAALSLAET